MSRSRLYRLHDNRVPGESPRPNAVVFLPERSRYRRLIVISICQDATMTRLPANTCRTRLFSGTDFRPMGSSTPFAGDAPRSGKASLPRPGWILSTMLLAVTLGSIANAQAQQSAPHPLHASRMPPGVVGPEQAYRIPGGLGYFQPVEVSSSAGANVGLFSGGRFTTTVPRINAALPVGGVYTYRVTNIPEHPGAELFPSVEVIHRLYPPDGLAAKFPIQVDINREDCEAALRGNFVVKVIYLESPEASKTQVHIGDVQPCFDLTAGVDLLSNADLMGRPVAILRMGSRQPDLGELQASAPTAQWQLLPTSDSHAASTVTQPWEPQTAGGDPTAAPGLHPPTEGYAALWNDEHIFDGGDRSTRALVSNGNQWEISGLETEDTIGHFDTLDGQRLVVPSNRVAIYSPRFAAIRQQLNAALTIREMPTLMAEGTDIIEVKGSKALPTTTAQFEAMRLMREAETTQAVRQRMIPAWNVGEVRTSRVSGTDAPAALSALIAQQQITGAEKAMIAKGRQAAIAWGGLEGVQILADFQSAQMIHQVQKADEIVESHSPFDRPKLRVVKLASKSAAHAGETVEFTLHFQNVGDQKIGNVTVLDNLPDRLEFVAGSATCDRACQFYTQDNELGSLLLRWDIDKPMAVGDSGTIRFTCRVR